MAAKSLSNDTNAVLWTDRRQFYIKPDTYQELWPAAKPFTTMLMGKAAVGGVRTTRETEVKLFEHRSGWNDMRFSANAATNWTTSGARGNVVTGLAIDTIVGLASSVDDSYEGLCVEIYASDNVTYKGTAMIQDAASSTTVTLVSLGNPRAVDGICLALADDDIYQVYGYAAGELSTAPVASSDELAVVYNSVQKFRRSVEVSNELRNAQLRGESDEAQRLLDLKQQEIMIMVENAMLKGMRPGGTGSLDLANDNTTTADSFSVTTTGSGSLVVRHMMGIIPAIYRYGINSDAATNQNIFDRVAASYSFSQFIDDMEKVMQYQSYSGMKEMHAGPGFAGQISKFCTKNGQWAGAVELEDSKPTEFGYDVRLLHTPHGSVRVVTNPNLNKQYRNTAVMVDPANVELIEYIDQGKTGLRLFTDIKKEDNYDGWKAEWKYMATLGITLIDRHSVWNLK